MEQTKQITYTALGVALYVCLSSTVKIPVIAHIGLDLGYIVLAVYCLKFGAVSGAIVGGAGCVLVSLIFSGWFPPGWFLGNLLIGAVCGRFYQRGKAPRNIILTVAAVFVGVGVIKTAVECVMFDIPLVVKFPKNFVAFVIDSITMAVGVLLSDKILRKE